MKTTSRPWIMLGKRAAVCVLAGLTSLTVAAPLEAGRTRATSPGDKLGKQARTEQAVMIVSVEESNGNMILRLDDGTSITAPASVVQIRDKGRKGGGNKGAGRISASSLKSGQAAVIKVKRNDRGIERVKVRLFPSMEEARKHLSQRPSPKQ